MVSQTSNFFDISTDDQLRNTPSKIHFSKLSIWLAITYNSIVKLAHLWWHINRITDLLSSNMMWTSYSQIKQSKYYLGKWTTTWLSISHSYYCQPNNMYSRWTLTFPSLIDLNSLPTKHPLHVSSHGGYLSRWLTTDNSCQLLTSSQACLVICCLPKTQTSQDTKLVARNKEWDTR